MSIAEKLTTVAENVPKVFEAGEQSEYDRFWDIYQQSGNRKDYSNAFAGAGWTTENFKPKYDINPTNIYMIFRGNAMNVDLADYLEKKGITLDFSQSTNTNYIFANSSFTRIGIVDVRGSTNSKPLDNAFANCYNLVTIDKIYLKTGASGEFNSTFTKCEALENVTFEGVISKNGLDMHWSTKLSADSLKSIINCLSPTAAGMSVTLPTTAQANYNAVYGEGAWAELIATKQNWEIKSLEV